jgi:predicted ATPase
MIMDSAVAWKFYHANSMNLEQIRLSDPKLGQSDSFVSPTGENLALVLFNLIQEEFEFDDSLNATIKDILPNTRRIRASPLGRYTLTVEWYVEGCSEPFFLSDMSDGTVRMLCWAVILHSPRPPALIFIDEPEIGIHPAWMPILADWIKRAAQKTQVIVTTHSPDLLDHFTDQLDEGGYIYTFQQDPDSQNHFKPKRLDKDTVSGWLEDGWQLGDLYRVGNPAVGGWPW